MATKKKVEENIVKEEVKETSKIEAVEPTFVTVAHCAKLNLRKEPRSDASITKILTAGEKLTLDVEFDSPAFLKVTTSDGTVGFVMKEFTSK